MKALLVAAAPEPGSTELVARLAPACDLVIAVDGGGAVCLDAGVVPQLVVGDFDSLSPEALDSLSAEGARVVWFPTRKDYTDLELALREAREAGATRVVLTCATSRRLDHTLAALGALAAHSDLWPHIVEPHLEAWVLAPQGRSELRLQGAGATISLVALGGSATVSASGVEWPLDRYDLPAVSGLGLSNEITGRDGARLSVSSGVVLVLAPNAPGSPPAGEI